MKYSFETKFPFDNRVKVINTELIGSVSAYTLFYNGDFSVLVYGDGGWCGEYNESELVKI